MTLPLPNGINQDLIERYKSKMSCGHQPTMSQISRPNGSVILYDHAFPPTLPNDLRKQEPVQDLMKVKGTWFYDAMYDTAYPDTVDVQFLCANHYMKTLALLSSDELELSQTHPVVKFWSILRQARFAGDVNALLPEPNNKEEMFVFFGVLTVKIDTTSNGNKIIKGPSRIIDQWQSLKVAGFTMVDAILPDPENQNKAWFFEGKKFISVCWEPGPVNDNLLDGPTLITEGWVSLKAVGFETIAAFVPNGQFPDKTWVISEDKYARICISADTVLSGPALLPEDWIWHCPDLFF